MVLRREAPLSGDAGATTETVTARLGGANDNQRHYRTGATALKVRAVSPMLSVTSRHAEEGSVTDERGIYRDRDTSI